MIVQYTYDVIGSCPYKRNGWRYRSQVCGLPRSYISQKKEKDGKAVIETLSRQRLISRVSSKENKVEIRLYYDERGLDKYGLLELGEIGGLWKNVAGRYEIGGKKIYAKQIYADPETYFDQYVMQALDEIAQKEFSYGES